VDLAFSWDSLVHAESDALDGYTAELARKLAPGGVGLLHHSNLAACRTPEGGFAADMDQAANGWRAIGMSAELFAALCDKNGLVCAAQEIFEWSRAGVPSDCVSLVVRGDGSPRAPRQVVRADMQGEMAAGLRLAELYGPEWKHRRPCAPASRRWWSRRSRLLQT